jgi:hypothetical protein
LYVKLRKTPKAYWYTEFVDILKQAKVIPNRVSPGKAGVVEIVSLDWPTSIIPLSLITFPVLASSIIIETEARRITSCGSQGSSETYTNPRNGF